VSNIPNFNIPKMNPPQFKKPKRLGSLIALGVVVLIGVNVLSSSFVSIDANEIGVKIIRGKIEGTLGPGWHLISPIGSRVERFSTRIQQTSMLRNPSEGDRTGDDSVEVASSEGAVMNVDVTINYRINKKLLVNLFQTIKSEDDLLQRIVRPGVRSTVRDVLADFKAKDARTSRRGEIQGMVSSRLKTKFEKQGVDVESIDIRDIYLPENIQAQVNESIAAEAANQRVAIQRKQKETEAETARLVAETAAAQARIEAQGKADAQRIEAQAQADSNRKIAESLTPGLIQLRQIEAVYKNGNQIYFLPQGASPNVFLTPTNNVGSPATPSPADQAAAGAIATNP
jgi:regulator of protease activity HflC (stomatin/prohibitin superfamily)